MIHVSKGLESVVYVHCNDVLPPDPITQSVKFAVTLTQAGSEDVYNVSGIFVSAQSRRYTTLRIDGYMTANIPAGVYLAAFRQAYVGESKIYGPFLLNVMDVDGVRPYVLDMDNYTTYEG